MKTLDQLPIKIDQARIARFCEERGIRKMSLFGSVVRDDFDPERSDVDVLVEFLPGALDGVGLAYFAYREDLGEILSRKVDFCTNLDKYIWPKVKHELIPIYEQA